MRPTRRMHAPVHASAPVWVYLNLRYVLVSLCVHRCIPLRSCTCLWNNRAPTYHPDTCMDTRIRTFQRSSVYIKYIYIRIYTRCDRVGEG